MDIQCGSIVVSLLLRSPAILRVSIMFSFAFSIVFSLNINHCVIPLFLKYTDSLSIYPSLRGYAHRTCGD